jgi:nucleoid-associated protein YgaU
MSFDDNQKSTKRNVTDSKLSSSPSHAHETPTPHPALHYKQHAGSTLEEEPDISLINQGKILAHTINLPFEKIPGLTAATPVLRRIDNATGQDLGFTYKGSVSTEENTQGGTDLRIKVDYIGFGFMSNKFNVQLAPLSEKIGVGEDVYKGFGCNLSTLASPIGFVHERLGAKATVTDCNSTSESISLAPEVSYQKSSAFKPISTATVGYFFGNDAALQIPAEYIPTLERIIAASPSLEEWKIIADHISPSIPAVQIGRLVEQGMEIAENLVKPKDDKADLHTQKIANSTENSNPISKPYTHQQATQQAALSCEGKKFYTVQQHDSLTRIGKKTGHPWPEIFALNKEKLQNNPDKIYPGQILHIPKNDNHMELLKNPVVQAQIIENLKKHQAVKKAESPLTQKVLHNDTYIVQLDDTLEKIGKKTGHPWVEILFLNQEQLKNNPNMIYPGQKLTMPEKDEHATLIHNPLVRARIQENMDKQKVQASPER